MKEDEFESNPSNEDRISLEASAWIAKRDEGFSPEDQDAFFEWLALDPEHREIYNDRLGFWENLNQLADWRPEHSVEPNPDLLACRRPSPWKSRIYALGGIAAVLVIGVFAYHNWKDSGRYEARMLAFGGAQSYENHVLDDGSIVELNRGAEVSVQYTRDRRLIFLHAGEAHFMVAKDLNRPFQVRAGDTIVEATGTAFNVALKEDGVEVFVTEGKVLVDVSSLVATLNDEEFVKRPVRELVAGQRSKFTRLGDSSLPEIDSISVKQIERRLAWKGEVLDFNSIPLSEVAEAFNRRNRTKIVIDDPDLLELEITAKLRSNNLDGFVELLGVTMNIVADREDASKIVLRYR